MITRACIPPCQHVSLTNIHQLTTYYAKRDLSAGDMKHIERIGQSLQRET
jgi:hypothetical protein